MPKFIDTHCHINFNRYDDDRDQIITRAVEANVQAIINPGIDVDTSQQAIALSEHYKDRVFATVGVHPNSTADFNESTLQQIESLSHHDNVFAIGEIGLDYYWDKSPKETQKKAFRTQLDLARRRELPVVIHNREASDDVLEILEEWVRDLPQTLQERPGVLHSFSAPDNIAERAINAGFYLGFTGPITFKNAGNLRQIAGKIPLERILLETDGPFLTPIPHRGKRNEPAYIPFIAERLSSLRRISIEKIAEITTENAVRLFQLPV